MRVLDTLKINTPFVLLIPTGGFKEDGSTFVQIYPMNRKKVNMFDRLWNRKCEANIQN